MKGSLQPQGFDRVVAVIVAAACIVGLATLIAVAPRDTSAPPPSATGQPSAEAATIAVSPRWTTTLLKGDAEAATTAGDQGAVAWVGGTSADDSYPLMYLAAGSDIPTLVASVPIPEYIWEITMEGDRLFWVVETDLDFDTGGETGDERHELFTWAPGDAKPTRLYSTLSPMEIGDVQVSGTRVLFYSMPPNDYDAQDEDNYDEFADQPHGWRVLDVRHPGVTRKVRIGAAGAQAVLGDGFVAWIEPGATGAFATPSSRQGRDSPGRTPSTTPRPARATLQPSPFSCLRRANVWRGACLKSIPQTPTPTSTPTW